MMDTQQAFEGVIDGSLTVVVAFLVGIALGFLADVIRLFMDMIRRK